MTNTKKKIEKRGKNYYKAHPEIWDTLCDNCGGMFMGTKGLSVHKRTQHKTPFYKVEGGGLLGDDKGNIKEIKFKYPSTPEPSEDLIPRNKSHGLSYTKFYRTYHLIKQRCNNPKCAKYSIYGGKGIKCEWNTFSEFKVDMYERYLAHIKLHGEKNTTIDRIDGSKNYNKDNCRWATYELQNRNRGSYNHLVTINGITKTLEEWAKESGINTKTVSTRVSAGWSEEKALTVPIRPHPNRQYNSLKGEGKGGVK